MSKMTRRKWVIARRDGLRCYICGEFDNLTVDHILPKSQGGKDNIENLQLLCVECHKVKTKEDEEMVKYNKGIHQNGMPKTKTKKTRKDPLGRLEIKFKYMDEPKNQGLK